MARFIAKYRNYETTVIHGLSPEEAYARGEKQRKTITAKFQWVGRGASPWEIDAALDRFEFQGVSVGEDPAWRLSFFDTEIAQKHGKWSDELRVEIEDNLRAHSSFGSDLIEVDQPRAPLPYDTYPQHRKVQGRRTIEHVIADVVSSVTLLGGNVADKVVAYEGDNPDGFSDQIVAAVREAVTPEPDEPLIAA